MIRNIKLIITATLLITFALFTNACDTESITSPNIFSLEDDVSLGKDLDGEIRKNTTEYPILNNANARQYVQNMINEIIKSPEVDYASTFAYQIEIIQRDDVINAFCRSGWLYVCLYRTTKICG